METTIALVRDEINGDYYRTCPRLTSGDYQRRDATIGHESHTYNYPPEQTTEIRDSIKQTQQQFGLIATTTFILQTYVGVLVTRDKLAQEWQ